MQTFNLTDNDHKLAYFFAVCVTYYTIYVLQQYKMIRGNTPYSYSGRHTNIYVLRIAFFPSILYSQVYGILILLLNS